jgi:uncharacterized membrane protein
MAGDQKAAVSSGRRYNLPLGAADFFSEPADIGGSDCYFSARFGHRLALFRREQLRKRLDTVDTQLTETTQELDHARSEQLRMKTEMADLLRLEARGEQAAKLEADMLREHIAEVEIGRAHV